MTASSLNNPFEYTRPLADPAKIMSRAEAVAEVSIAVSRNEYVALLAPRQTGKTTFLDEVRRRIGERCVYVDFEGADYVNLAALTQDFARKTAAYDEGLEDSEEKQYDSFLDFLLDLKQAEGRVFLIDELPCLKHIAIEFLRSVRAYYNESRLLEPASVHKFVISGSIDLPSLTLDADSPYNIARTINLEDFGPEEVHAFIRRLAGEAFSEKSIRRIYEYTKGHPFLVQFLCHHLYDLPATSMERQLDDLTTLVEESEIEGSVNIQSMVEHVLGDDEAVELLEKIIEGQHLPFTFSSPHIRALYFQHGCVREEEGKCAIRNPIYNAVLKKNFEIRRISQSRETRPNANVADRGVESSAPFEEITDSLSPFLEAFQAIARVEKQLESVARMEKRLDTLLQVSSLKNYHGFLCVRFAQDGEGDTPTGSVDNVYRVAARQRFRLSAWLQPEQPAPDSALYERVDVTDGEDREEDGTPVREVEFEVAVEGEGISIEKRSQKEKVFVDRPSGNFEFFPEAPAKAGEYPVWIQVFQGNRLLQVLDLKVVVH